MSKQWRIIDRNKIPKGGFDYTVPESGRRFRANTLSRLLVQVQEYQAANSYAIISEQALEQHYCERHPELCDDGTARPQFVEPGHHDDLLTRLAAAVGIPAADALSKLTGKLGINCAICSKRHATIRRVRELGFAETLRLLKETF